MHQRIRFGRQDQRAENDILYADPYAVAVVNGYCQYVLLSRLVQQHERKKRGKWRLLSWNFVLSLHCVEQQVRGSMFKIRITDKIVNINAIK